MAAPTGVDPAMWAALLRWSMKCQADGDGTAPTDFKKMSKEDRDFLEEVMKEGIVDHVKRSAEIVDELKNKCISPISEGNPLTDEACEELEIMMEELQDIVEQIDFAKALVQIGGMPPLIEMANETNVPEILRMYALAIIATTAQNNPYAQDALLGMGALPIFVALLAPQEGEAAVTPSSKLRQKALYATSCLVRSHARAEASFCGDLGGFGILMTIISAGKQPDGNTQLERRATFLTNALFSSVPDVCLDGTWEPMTEALVTQLESASDVDLREQTVNALLGLAHRGFKAPLLERFGERINGFVSNCRQGAVDDDEEKSGNAAAELRLWEEFLSCV